MIVSMVKSLLTYLAATVGALILGAAALALSLYVALEYGA
ncbi:hypothetical protein M2302_002270 [Micromonospora sp. A200]|nr:hypothetical protein [Micromonospora sp. A200]